MPNQFFFYSGNVVVVEGDCQKGWDQSRINLTIIACEHALSHVSRVFHLFLISPIFIITETRACKHALENFLPIYLILVYHISIVKL